MQKAVSIDSYYAGKKKCTSAVITIPTSLPRSINRVRLQRRRDDDAHALPPTLRRDDLARLPDRDVVDVDVRDSGRGAQALRDIVRVACGGQPGADVDKLHDVLLRYPARDAPQESAVFDGHGLGF